MADVKISGLPAATTPLAGTEVLPIVQSTTTKKVSIADVTAGRSVSAASLSLTTTPLAVTSGGIGLATVAQGDLLYGSASNTLSALAKNTTASRYLSNSGTSNNPAWAQVDLTNGVTGTLPTGNGGTGVASFTQYGVFYATSTSALSTAGNLTFDGKDLGVGLSRVSFGANMSGITLDNTGASQNIVWRVNSVTQASAFTNGTSGFIFGTESSTPLQFQIGGVVKAELQTDGDFSIGNGNLVISTSGKGIDFSATPGTGTSELLADYEEGTWTPTDASGAGLTFVQASGKYTKVGRQVTAWAFVNYPVTASGANLSIGGLPFTIANTAEDRSGGMLGYSTTATVASVLGLLNTTTLFFYTSAGAGVTNADASNGSFYFAFTYNV